MNTLSTNRPVIILVRPQMGENIGMAARAMANFALCDLRLVAPRDGWGEASTVYKTALDTAVGANAIVRRAELYPDVQAAVQDLHKLFATTARERDQAKPVLDAAGFAEEAKARGIAGQKIGILFGPERTGLENPDIILADALVSFPVSPDYPSLNLAQSVSLVAYEWFKAFESAAAPFQLAHVTPPASRAMLQSFFDELEAQLTAGDYFIPDNKRAIMSRNLRNIIHRMALTEADVRTLRGVVVALARGRLRKTRDPQP